MPKVIYRAIVSSPHELNFIKMSLAELRGVADHFLICEANITHTGEHRDFQFESLIKNDTFFNEFPVLYIPMDLIDDGEYWNNSSEVLHANEQKIRNGFSKFYVLNPADIVISVDADEVIHRRKALKYIRRLNRKILPRKSYSLRLHQVIFKVSYFWKNCDFRGPVICRAEFYGNDSNAQWRYGGFPTFLKSGTHFSWVMSPSDMVAKILRYSHRKEYESFADIDILQQAIQAKKYVFDPKVNFRVILKKPTSRIYPKSLRNFIGQFDPEVR
jgi:hypothetical protein